MKHKEGQSHKKVFKQMCSMLENNSVIDNNLNSIDSSPSVLDITVLASSANKPESNKLTESKLSSPTMSDILLHDRIPDATTAVTTMSTSVAINTNNNHHTNSLNYQNIEDFLCSFASLSLSCKETGYIVSNEVNRENFKESALIGTFIANYDDSAQRSRNNMEVEEVVNNTMNAEKIYLNTHEPFCITAVGVQGSGKSHTLACILESCLLPFHTKESSIIQLEHPMNALVLHYDTNITSICEVTGLIVPCSSLVQQIEQRELAFLPPSNSLNKSVDNHPCLDKDNLLVLVSPSYYLQRKAFYGEICTVKPLLLRWKTLTADHLKRLMRLSDNDNQLYVAILLDLLRNYQRKDRLPSFKEFIEEIKEKCNIKGQESALTQRLRLLESVIAESEVNAPIEEDSCDLQAVTVVKPGMLIVVDFTDPFLCKDDVNAIFQVLTEKYRAIPSCLVGGKLLVLDEAHKYMDADGQNNANDGLSAAIVNCARLMRHDGMRLMISTQNPRSLAPELLELSSLCILHRFCSNDWLNYLKRKLPLSDVTTLQQLTNLAPGQAIVFAAKHKLFNINHSNDNIFMVNIRKRITLDRGASKTNKSVAVTSSEKLQIAS